MIDNIHIESMKTIWSRSIKQFLTYRHYIIDKNVCQNRIFQHQKQSFAYRPNLALKYDYEIYLYSFYR